MQNRAALVATDPRFFPALAAILFGCSGEPIDRPLVVDAGPSPDALTSPLSEPDATFDVAYDAAVECRLAQADGTVCACVELGQRPPTLYLLLDRSGSMGEPAPGSSRTKWELVRTALLDEKKGALRQLGGRLTIAAAWFPSPSAGDACSAGRQVFEPQRGSRPVYDALGAKLASAIPRGATPTAASLGAIMPLLPTVPAPAYVLLATDGAPNCGTTPCAPELCTYNIEHDQLTFSGSCDSELNCCDPGKTARGLGWQACVDVGATRNAASAIAEAGYKVFVLGVPGTPREYGAVLDEIAIAGGAPRDGFPRYYAADDSNGLADALAKIAGRVVDTCDIRLESPVVDPGITNVLLDSEVVTDWKWTSSSTIELTGAACDRVHEGRVASVQVVVGCRTVTK